MWKQNGTLLEAFYRLPISLEPSPCQLEVLHYSVVQLLVSLSWSLPTRELWSLRFEGLRRDKKPRRNDDDPTVHVFYLRRLICIVQSLHSKST